MKKKLYYLTGFMAAGKSTIGPILANTLGWEHFDLDREIEKSAGKKITEIFKSEGEDYFRKLETKLLSELSKKEKAIVSLGGGTIADQDNFNIIRATGNLIYLKSSPEMAYKRLLYKRDRPNIHPDNDSEPDEIQIMQKISNLLEQRKKFYEQADFILDTDNETIGRTVDKISKYILSNKKR